MPRGAADPAHPRDRDAQVEAAIAVDDEVAAERGVARCAGRGNHLEAQRLEPAVDRRCADGHATPATTVSPDRMSPAPLEVALGRSGVDPAVAPDLDSAGMRARLPTSVIPA